MRQPLLRFVLAAAALCVSTSVATAQIYVSRDANGTITLSDKPLGPDAVTYAVPKAQGVRTTKSVATFAGGRYDDIIAAHASTHSVRPELVRAVIAVESGFNPRARSSKGLAIAVFNGFGRGKSQHFASINQTFNKNTLVNHCFCNPRITPPFIYSIIPAYNGIFSMCLGCCPHG